MSRIAWRFRDIENPEDYYLPVNPLEDNDSNAISKQTKYEQAISTYVSPVSGVRVDDIVIQDSPSDVKRFSYRGTLYTKDQYDAFLHWFAKPYPWELKDDLAREYLVYVEEFAPSRERSTKFRWKHSYTFSGLILRELGV